MENIILKTFKLALSVNDLISTVKDNGNDLDCIADLSPISTPPLELVNTSILSGKAGKKRNLLRPDKV